MTAVLNSKFEKMENDEKQLNNLKIEVENKLSIMGKRARESTRYRELINKDAGVEKCHKKAAGIRKRIKDSTASNRSRA
eukprot:TRINITY_DN1234_c0_g1_i1.p1 TRINITY_DN1234_c0_g1~~TRINITY_DN1234_c0_g1_i1.p1  ORF type:complete len:79 (-),score=20.03 TRINITY_DN1234_c0_g1_i1:17-253(-)